jgi:hypothetical protein
MKGRVPMIFLLITAVLAVFVYFYEYKGKTIREKATESEKQLFPVEDSLVQKIELNRLQDSLVFVRHQERWVIEKPIHADADEWTAKGLVSDLVGAKAERTISGVDEWVSFGLNPPEASVVLHASGMLPDTMDFGYKNPTNTYLFARRHPKDSTVVLTNSSLHSLLNKSLFDFRNKSILRFESENVRQMTIESGNGRFVFSRDGEIWSITSPIRETADQTTVNGLLNQVKNIRIKAFESEDPRSLAAYGLDRPRIRFSLLLGEEKSEKRLVIGGRKDTGLLYAMDLSQRSVFLVDTSIVRTIAKPLFDFRDKTVVTFQRDSVTVVEISEKGKPNFVCSMDETGSWVITSPRVAKAKEWKISSLISDVENLRAIRFFDDNPINLRSLGLDTPKADILFKTKENRNLAEILVGRRLSEGQVVVYNPLTRRVFGIASESVDSILPAIDDFAEMENTAPVAPKEDSTASDQK